MHNPHSEVRTFDSLKRLVRSFSTAVHICITDEMLFELRAAGFTRWESRFSWQRDICSLMSHGDRIYRRTPRREKRRARKRRGK